MSLSPGFAQTMRPKGERALNTTHHSSGPWYPRDLANDVDLRHVGCDT